MAEQTANRATTAAGRAGPSPWAGGLTAFAGSMMVMLSGFPVIVALAALARDDIWALATHGGKAAW